MSDLSDAEFAELDELLAATPQPLDPLDAVMLDGYLCGVLVQPVLLARSDWLPPVFDLEGQALPESVDPAWRARCTALIERRYASLQRSLADDGWIDPLVLELDQSDEPAMPEELRALGPVSSALMPWVSGFQYAAIRFPDLAQSDNEAVMDAMDRLYRHLPSETDEDREMAAALDREHPLETLEKGIEDLVLTIAELADLTRAARFHVEPVRRDTPKVGRNDPCPCGSGRKFKQCHGT